MLTLPVTLSSNCRLEVGWGCLTYLITRSPAKQASAAIRRARKGGALTAPQLLAVAGLAAGAIHLRRTVNTTAKQAGELRPESELQPILTAVKVLRIPSILHCPARTNSKPCGIQPAVHHVTGHRRAQRP